MTRLAQHRLRLLGVLGVVLTLGATAACTGTTAQWTPPGGSPTASSPGSDPSNTAGPSALTVNPANNATDVEPGNPVTVSIANGTLNDVVLTNPQGKVVNGAFSADKTSWTTTVGLGYSKKYTLKSSGNGADGQVYSDTRSFTTATPRTFTMPRIIANDNDWTLLDGGTFGVGQIIVVRFDESIKDKAAAERNLIVTTDPPGIVGGWKWASDQEVHWRPQVYWPAGTKVTVEAKVYGHNLGNRIYGEADRTAHFTIGRSRIAIADSKTHLMKVFIDGNLVTEINGKTFLHQGGKDWKVANGIPISMGRGGSTVGDGGQIIYFTTNSGPHVITVKSPLYRMTSASFGLSKGDFSYDVNVKDTLRISGDGEFVHMAPWSEYQQGHSNVSHGCINVGTVAATWFYSQFGPGDVVDVKNTTAKLNWLNGLGDWVISWADWQKGSALH